MTFIIDHMSTVLQSWNLIYVIISSKAKSGMGKLDFNEKTIDEIYKYFKDTLETIFAL